MATRKRWMVTEKINGEDKKMDGGKKRTAIRKKMDGDDKEDGWR